MTLGIPGGKPATCEHKVPTFGCDGCILGERRGTLEAARRTTAPPPCSLCNGPTEFYDSNVATMTLLYVCAGTDHDEDGVPACDAEVKVR